MFSGTNTWVLSLAIFFFTNSLIGISTNGIMILCFLRSKRLRSPCHVLISLTCFSDILHLSGPLIFAIFVFNSVSSTQPQCFFVNILPIIGLGATGTFNLATGIDRLIAVKFPARYRIIALKPMFYISLQLIFPLAYVLTLLYLGFTFRITDGVKLPVCSIPISLAGVSFEFFNFSNAIIYFLVIIVYATVFFQMNIKQANAQLKRVIRSISMTVGLVIFGWVSCTVINAISYKVTDVLFTSQIIQMYAGVPPNLAAAANLLVYYVMNSEYRKVMNRMFGCKTDLPKKISQVQSVSQRNGTVGLPA